MKYAFFYAKIILVKQSSIKKGELNLHIQNLHTHTKYCDGENTPEEIVLEAINKGFTSIGFSGHSYADFSPWFRNHGNFTDKYIKDVFTVKEKYKDKIKVYLGLEVEMYAKIDTSPYDYLIGSLHYAKLGNEYIGVDKNSDEVQNVINTYFNGSGIEYAKFYYQNLARMPEYGKFDIIGHFDLITKHSDKVSFFDESSKEYLDAAFEAAEVLAKKIPFFEVNTGAIARGYRKTPYPSVPIIKYFKELGLGAVITSDCHNKEMLDCGFKEAEELLKECGFKEKYILTDNGFVGNLI